jgi:hypothetical protein
VVVEVEADGVAAGTLRDGQQSGRLSAQPIMGNSQMLPSGCSTTVNCGIKQVPVSNACPVYGVVGKARDLDDDVAGGGNTVSGICTVDLEVVVTTVGGTLAVPDADLTNSQLDFKDAHEYVNTTTYQRNQAKVRF